MQAVARRRDFRLLPRSPTGCPAARQPGLPRCSLSTFGSSGCLSGQCPGPVGPEPPPLKGHKAYCTCASAGYYLERTLRFAKVTVRCTPGLRTLKIPKPRQMRNAQKPKRKKRSLEARCRRHFPDTGPIQCLDQYQYSSNVPAIASEQSNAIASKHYC